MRTCLRLESVDKSTAQAHAATKDRLAPSVHVKRQEGERELLGSSPSTPPGTSARPHADPPPRGTPHGGSPPTPTHPLRPRYTQTHLG